MPIVIYCGIEIEADQIVAHLALDAVVTLHLTGIEDEIELATAGAQACQCLQSDLQICNCI